MRELPVHSMTDIGRPGDDDSQNICLMHPARKYFEGKRRHVFIYFPNAQCGREGHALANLRHTRWKKELVHGLYRDA